MKRITLVLTFVFFGLVVFGQTYQIDRSKSSMSIKGTSSLHDWESVVETFTGEAKISSNQVESVTWVAQVKSIKSGKSAMDDNTYEAMKADKHPEIRVEAHKLNWNNSRLNGTINLTIAGVTKQVPVNLSMVNNGTLEVKGEVPIKMTTFGIEPPTAVFGTIKTGDEITIVFDLILIK